jgi:hypothetical protein
MKYELNCRYDTRQSFYGKAVVKETEYIGLTLYELYSYGTLVAKIEETEIKKTYIYEGQFSQTTTRHQKEFFKQNGLSDKEIKELFKKGVLEVNK